LDDCKESEPLERVGATGPGFGVEGGSTGSLKSIKSVLKSNADGDGGVLTLIGVCRSISSAGFELGGVTIACALCEGGIDLGRAIEVDRDAVVELPIAVDLVAFD
jgi:hypothetical protein